LLSPRAWPRLGLRAATVALLALSGCERASVPSAEDIGLSWSVDPRPLQVGRTTLVLRLTDPQGSPIRGARLRAEADMTHPGMRPVVADAVERAPGVYEAHLDLEMAGAWMVFVSGDLPGPRALSRQLDLGLVRARSKT